MEKLFLVGYTHKHPATCEPESKAISFGESQIHLFQSPTNMVRLLEERIKEMTLEEDIHVTSITPLHKIAEYAS